MPSVVYKRAMATTALPQRHGTPIANVLAGVAAAVVIACAALYLMDRREARQAETQAVTHVAAVIQQSETEAQWLEQAIREKRAILGMTRYEVEMAKGKPAAKHRGQAQPEAMRNAGAVETWIYDTPDGKGNSVLFGVNGLVTFSMDAYGKPREGYAIRQ